MKKTHTEENRIVSKLRSRAGASITFALLLFLVCASLSAVVLVAATTAAGRLSNIVEADQKYYAVMSAVELINDSMDDQAISTVVLNDDDTKKDFLKPMNEVNENDIKNIDNIDVALDNETYDADDEDDEKINPSAPGSKAASSEKASFEKVITDLYNSDANVGSHKFTFKTSTSSTVGSMEVSVNETIDRSKGIVSMTVAPAGSTNGMLLVYAVDKADKYPPVTQVEVQGSERRVTSAYETTWHLVRMVSTFEENGDT